MDNTLGAITFTGVATGTVNIQDIVPYAPKDEELADWMFNLQTFTPSALAAEQFGYFVTNDDGMMEDEDWKGAGWYDFETNKFADKEFKVGEGFMLNSSYGDDSGAGYQIAGAVVKGESKIPLNMDNTLVGNIRPCNFSIQKIHPYAPEGEELSDWMMNIQTFTPSALAKEQFGYFVTNDDGMMEDEDWEGPGWYDFETNKLSDKSFLPGEGFMINSAYGDIESYEEGKSAGIAFEAVVE